MPSNSLLHFEQKLLSDVKRLISHHKSINTGRGNPQLGFITRSATFMLCAAWEQYIELVLGECAVKMTETYDSLDKFPKSVRTYFITYIREIKDESLALKLCGNGWKDVYRKKLEEELGGFNTPKSENINKIYERYLGLSDLSASWSCGSTEIDRFVRARGDIAHKGSGAKYVRFNDLLQYQDIVKKSAIETDNKLVDYFQEILPGSKSIWNRRKV